MMNKAVHAAILAYTASAYPANTVTVGAGLKLATFDNVSVKIPTVGIPSSNIGPYLGISWTGMTCGPQTGGTPKNPIILPNSLPNVLRFPAINPTIPGVPSTGTPGTGLPGVGLPSLPGLPTTGTPGTGVPGVGLPSLPGLPTTGTPGTGLPGVGLPSLPGLPTTGTPGSTVHIPVLPAMGIPGGGAGSFDLKNFCFGCALKGTIAAGGIPSNCVISVKGYTDDAGTKLAGAKTFAFNALPRVGAGAGVTGGQAMTKAVLDDTFKGLRKVTFDISGTGGALLADLAMLDNIGYYYYESGSGSGSIHH